MSIVGTLPDVVRGLALLASLWLAWVAGKKLKQAYELTKDAHAEYLKAREWYDKARSEFDYYSQEIRKFDETFGLKDDD